MKLNSDHKAGFISAMETIAEWIEEDQNITVSMIVIMVKKLIADYDKSIEEIMNKNLN